jgi:hypothetical protein
MHRDEVLASEGDPLVATGMAAEVLDDAVNARASSRR